jgi:MOSC domain-containing protein YiiM
VGNVLYLFQAVAHGEPVREFDEVSAVENRGFQGCIHGRTGSRRQVLLMDFETLEEFGIPPGSVKENITTRGIGLGGLAEGQRLRAGEVLLEVTVPCTPCGHMDEIREGLKEALRGRRGVLCRVLEPGQIRRGDTIEVIQQQAALRGNA